MKAFTLHIKEQWHKHKHQESHINKDDATVCLVSGEPCVILSILPMHAGWVRLAPLDLATSNSTHGVNKQRAWCSSIKSTTLHPRISQGVNKHPRICQEANPRISRGTTDPSIVNGNPADPRAMLGYRSARGDREEHSMDGDGSDRITHMGDGRTAASRWRA
jgi:hypothetical protein